MKPGAMADADEPKFIQMRSIDDTEGEELKVVGELKVASPARAGHHAVLRARGPGGPAFHSDAPCSTAPRLLKHASRAGHTHRSAPAWPVLAETARCTPPGRTRLPAPGSGRKSQRPNRFGNCIDR